MEMTNTKNKVKFGLKNCHYATTTIAEDGTITYGTLKSLPGSVSLALDAEGENDPFYADDSVYYMKIRVKRCQALSDLLDMTMLSS